MIPSSRNTVKYNNRNCSVIYNRCYCDSKLPRQITDAAAPFISHMGYNCYSVGVSWIIRFSLQCY